MAQGAGGASNGDSHLLQGILNGILAQYWEHTPTAGEAIEAIEEHYDNSCICFDHFAFRTFGVEGLGIASLSKLFTDFGYQQRGQPLVFPAKKLEAFWYAPPDPSLPRVFISELKVGELSGEAQEVIARYTTQEGTDVLARYAALSSVLGMQPWPTPTRDDYQLLAKSGPKAEWPPRQQWPSRVSSCTTAKSKSAARKQGCLALQESEYAAWVLVNGYALNHTTVSVHHLKGPRDIHELNDFLQKAGFQLNASGGVTKVSPDGLLLQSSTMADQVCYTFAGDETEKVAGAYIEFAERLVLPEFRHLPLEEVEEHHRRDGFEAGSADRIFESTTISKG
ncbi:hypothetical protein N2152v2_006683 [Parachlorella kessleri]